MMKTFKKVLSVLTSLFCSFVLLFSMVSCKTFEAKLTLTADKALAFPTEEVHFTTTVEANMESKSEVYYEIVSGSELASISSKGVLTVSENAKNGGTVVVMSTLEEFKSNKVAVEIGINVESVTARASKTTLNSGNAVSLNADVLPANATYPEVKWEVVEGSNLCVLTGNVLIVDDNVGTDETIKVKAVADGVYSNVLEFTINPFVLDVNLVLTSDKVKAYAGDVVNLTTTVKANSDSYDAITYEITEGSELASVSADGKLTINSTSNEGGKVVVVSKSGAFTSNEIEIALGIKAESIQASANSYELLPGAAVTLTSVVAPENAENKNVTWSIVEGSTYGTVVGNVLLVNDEIEEVSKITVKASIDSIESNVLVFTITPPVVDVDLSLTADKNFAYPTEVITLTTKDNAKDDISSLITYEIISGSDLATVSTDGKVTIKETANTGGKVVVVSKYNDFVSNEIEIEIGIHVSNVTISSNKTELGSGSAVTLYSVISPENASNKALTWEILEGNEICEINGNVLLLADEIDEAATIKVQATVDGIKSNVLSFTVNPDIHEINLVLTSDKNLAFPGEVVSFNTQVKSDQPVTETVTYEIKEGSSLATISADGKLTINETSTTGGKVVVVSKIGEFVSNEIEVNVGINVSSVTISASKTEVGEGNAIQLSSTILPSNATNQNVSWSILQGQDLCVLLGNVIFINDEITEDGIITVRASVDGVNSNIIELTVKAPIVVLELTLSSNATSAYPTETIQFSTEVSPESEEQAEYYIVSGSDLATIDSNTGLLTIKETATNGGTVIVRSRINGFESNRVSISVLIKVESITISSQVNSLLAGNSTPINVEINPINATNQNITWTFVEGEENAYFVSNVLFIKAGVASGSEITVKAVVDGVNSNELTFTVEKTKEEINAEKLYISLNSENLTVDKNGVSSPKLIAYLYDGNLDEVTNKDVLFEIENGEEFVSLSQVGKECSFTVLGHGSATVRVTIDGTEVSQTATINTILPPTALKLHEVYAQRSGYNYNFSKVDELYFPVTPLGTNVCDEYVVTFKDASNNTGDEVATYNYETGKILFKSKGLVTVTVTSTSGSRLEASNSYTFNINEGINVETYDELRSILHYTKNQTYNGEQINFVVLEKPTTTAYEYEYGYDLVPSVALNAKTPEGQPISKIMGHGIGILIYDRNLHINGNNHTIDVSQVRVVPIAEQNASVYKDVTAAPAVINIKPTMGKDSNGNDLYDIPAVDSTKNYQVNLYDFAIKGNTPIDFGGGSREGENLNKHVPTGVFESAINLGQRMFYDRYYVDMNNITLSAFKVGVTFAHVVEGNVKNLNVNNCFSNGVECYASKITFTDINLGRCGAAGLEAAAPENSMQAGYDFNEAQTIVFAGDITTSNYNSGNTVYMQNYDTGLGGVTVTDIINGAVAALPNLTEEGRTNLQNNNGEFVFVTFIFHHVQTGVVNNSVIQYKDVDGSGIINASELTGIDTTHKYILMDIPIAQLGGMSMGKALLYNLNYVNTLEE